MSERVEWGGTAGGEFNQVVVTKNASFGQYWG